MSGRGWKAIAALLVVCALLFAGWLWTHPKGGSLPSPEVAPPASGTEPTPAAKAVDTKGEVRTAVDTPPAPRGDEDVPKLLVYPAQRELAEVEGIVLDGVERPVAGASVSLEPSRGAIHPWLAIADDRSAQGPLVTDKEGRFHFARVPVGPYEVSAVGLAGLVARAQVAVVDADAAPIALHLVGVAIPEDLTVVVIDAQKNPVAGATVSVHVIPPTQAVVEESHTPNFTAVSGADGKVVIPMVPLAPLIVDASTANKRRGSTLFDRDQRGYSQSRVQVIVGAAGGIDGKLGGATRERLAGSSVRALQLLRPDQPYYSTFGRSFVAPVTEEGFHFRDLPAGVFAVEFDSPNGLRFVRPPLEDTPNSIAPLTVAVSEGAVAQLDAAVDEGGELAGTVLTLDGKPIAGARVRAVLTPLSANLTDGFAIFGAHVWRLDSPQSLVLDHPTAHASARTDALGAYRIVGLTPGAYRVDVFASGESYDQRLDVAVELGRPTRLEHRLAAAGVIQGYAPEITYLGAVPKGFDKPAVLAILPDDGLFTLPGLAAGDFSLESFPSDTTLRPIHVADVHVDAGRTTWIDLSRAGTLRIDARLVDGTGTGLIGMVTVHGLRMETAADGRFHFQMFEPRRDQRLTMPFAFVEIGGLQWRLDFTVGENDAPREPRTLKLGEYSLAVLLLDPDGRPVAGTLEANSENLQPSRLPVGPDGRATLRNLFPGEILVKAEVPDGVVPPQLVLLPEMTSIELKALPSSPIEVRVVDDKGKAAARIRVFAQAWQSVEPPPADLDEFARKAQFYETTTDYDGVAHILAPSGHVLVTATGWYIGDPTARQRILTVRGKPEKVSLTVR